MDHPNIPLLYSILVTPTQTILVLEYAPNGHLTPAIPQSILRSTIIPGIAAALEHIHGLKIAHLDVKPDNILLSPHYLPRLADFGSALPFSSTLSAVHGTLQYLSPAEASSYFTHTPYDPVLTDYFSFAATMFYCLTGTHVHDNLDPAAPLEDTLKAIAVNPVLPRLPDLPPPFHSILAPLLTSQLTMHTSRAESLRQSLQSHYSHYAPTETSKIETLISRVVGGPPSSVAGLTLGGVLWTEHELFSKIEAKYETPPVQTVPIPEHFAIDKFKETLRRPPQPLGFNQARALDTLTPTTPLYVPPVQSPNTLCLLTGPSGSGKSTLAATLAASAAAPTVIISQDSYFTSPFIPYSSRTDSSRERFEGNVDSARLFADVLTALATSAVICEGHIIHRCRPLLDLADHVVVLDVSPEVCKTRRLERQDRSSEERADLADYIDRIVAPFYADERAFLDACRSDPRFAAEPPPRVDPATMDGFAGLPNPIIASAGDPNTPTLTVSSSHLITITTPRYAIAAHSFDHLAALLKPSYVANALISHVTSLHSLANKSVLELTCGDGRVGLHLARANSTCQVTLTDENVTVVSDVPNVVIQEARVGLKSAVDVIIGSAITPTLLPTLEHLLRGGAVGVVAVAGAGTVERHDGAFQRDVEGLHGKHCLTDEGVAFLKSAGEKGMVVKIEECGGGVAVVSVKSGEHSVRCDCGCVPKIKGLFEMAEMRNVLKK